MDMVPRVLAQSGSLDGDHDVREDVREFDVLDMMGILDHARLPAVVMEGAGHLVRYANPAFCSLVGKSREEIVGRPFAGIPDCGHCAELFDRVYRTSHAESYTGPERAEHDGAGQGHAETGKTERSPVYWSYEAWPVIDGGSRPAGVAMQVTETTRFHRRATAMNEALLVAAVRQHEFAETLETLNAKLELEMAERQRAQEALLRSEMLASAGRMAASIAHEVNNPLEAVVNTLYLARTFPGLPAEVREYLEIADGELMRVAHIARQTLGFYRELSEPTSNSASALMTSVVNLMQSKIRSSGATVVQQCDGDLRVAAVAGELRQVISNLLSNSLDAVNNRNGVVKLRCSTLHRSGTRDAIRMTVADNGKGMSAATIGHIFEPFFTTKGAVGTGLGLWVCKQLVEKNGGSIRVHSSTEGEHQGTTFSIVLACGEASAA